ncbi:MAG: 4,5-DOPA dioxygenase extradiol [Leptospiraceae bacterium]|nr:4,5-DOPA dioxygenase extradiol [Leptospiraceae bacterium]MCP5498532.1 4,5-DOPA dioxygenase extradiol [Leptospiraceae bacterium]
MKEKSLQTALFIGHGSPMNIIEENGFTKTLKEFRNKLTKPDAILIISAHWLTEGTFITAQEHPQQIYDFFGFPPELYQIKYEPPGKSELAKIISFEIPEIKPHMQWGLDHGSWSVLHNLFPEAEIPVLQLSIDYTWPERYHYELGKKLRFLRERNILVIGSGNVVHNLQKVDMKQVNAEPCAWAVEFDSWVKDNLDKKNDVQLCQYYKKSDIATRLSVPTPEHYLPMIYILGMRMEDETVKYIYEGFQNRSISMRSFYY